MALRDASRAGGKFGHDAALRAFYKRAESGRGDGVRKVQRSSLAFLRRALVLLFSFLGRIKADKDLSRGGTRPYFPGFPENFLSQPLFFGLEKEGRFKKYGFDFVHILSDRPGGQRLSDAECGGGVKGGFFEARGPQKHTRQRERRF